MKRIGSFVLALMTAFLIIPSVSAAAVAIPNASLYLSNYVAYVYPEGDGDISVWFEVQGTKTMDEIGVLSIRLQEKASSSSSWTTVETYSHNDYSNLLGSDENFYSSHVDYAGIEGYSYRAYVTFWAGNMML
jgi:hypothetical protein